MDKRILLGLASFAAFAVVAAFPVVASADGAIVIKDSGCGLLDGNGNGASAESTISITNDGGVTIFKCSAKDLPNDAGRAVRFDFENTGFLCGTFGGATEDWENQVSASGNATLTCKVKN